MFNPSYTNSLRLNPSFRFSKPLSDLTNTHEFETTPDASFVKKNPNVGSSSQETEVFNLADVWDRGDNYDLSLRALRDHSEDFQFHFKKNTSKLNPEELTKDIEICQKVLYSIVRKFEQLKLWHRRGVLKIQDTSLSVSKKCYQFLHIEKDRKNKEEIAKGTSSLKRRSLVKIVESSFVSVKEGGKCPVCSERKPQNCSIE